MRKSVAVVVAAVGLLGACSSGGEPHAVAEPTRWDPCSITPEQIAATGLDPGYRSVGWGKGIVVDDWGLCSFQPYGFDVPYVLAIRSSSDHTVDEARENSANLAGRDEDVDGRDAFQYETHVSRSIRDCNLAVDVSDGVVVFTVNYGHGYDDVDPCEILIKHVEDLKSSLPPSNK